MRERTTGWLASVLRRAPMGLIQSATFVVGGGALILAGLVIPSDAHVAMWVVWWISLPFGVLLFIRGVIGAAGWMVQQGWFVTSEVQRRGLPRIRVEWPDPKLPPERVEEPTSLTAADFARTHVGTYDGGFVPRPQPLPAPTPTPDADADILDITPDALVALLEGKTDLQAKTDVSKYVGERMRVSGPLANVHSNDRLVVMLATPRVAYLYFGKEWSDTLATIPPGQVIEVVGRIESVHHNGVSLEQCALAQSSSAAIS